MLTVQLMESMDDAHLVAVLRAEQDPLTSSAAEIELLARLEAKLDEIAPAMADVLYEYDVTPEALEAIHQSHPCSLKEMAELLKALSNAEIHTPEQLAAVIAMATSIKGIANDAGDAFTRLSQLITTAQE